MNKLLYALIISIFFLDYLSLKLGLISRIITWAPELLSGVALLIVALLIAKNKSIAITPKYSILAIIFFLHIFVGILINSVSPGTVFVGLRNDIKWLPFLLLPMAYHFSDKEISNQLKLLLFFALFQFPLSLFQRLIQFKNIPSGDMVTGTLNDSGVLSIYLMSVIAMVVAFFARGKLKKSTAIVMIIMLFIPTTINETKITLILLPVSLLLPPLFSSISRFSVSQMIGIIGIGLFLFVIYIPVYNHFIKPTNAPGLSELDERHLSYYLFRGNDPESNNFFDLDQIKESLGLPLTKIPSKGTPRGDSIILPIGILSEDPIKLFVGLGIGNASSSFLSAFSGEYSYQVGEISGKTGISFLLWETGIGGLIIFLTFLSFLFIDARNLAKRNEMNGTISSGFIAIIVIVLILLPYKNFFIMNVIIYFFTYLSGYVIAERYRDIKKSNK